IAIANACLPAEHLNNMRDGYHCDAFTHFAMQRAERNDVSTVFIAFNTWWFSAHPLECPSVDWECVGSISVDDADRLFLQDFSDRIGKLRMKGKRVIISLPFPIYDKSIPDLLIRNAVFGRMGPATAAHDIAAPELREKLLDVARAAGADVFDPRKSLCDSRGCITQLQGVSIYKDDNHLAASQLGLLEANLRQALE
ncbi:MAG TPA: SGNH hydrolase domain-containing protein, partial [Vicinamibacterales bacterium]|nr:SGNH hydrolase domain-containing protein [Vicinamibacterales bacterium]